MYSLLIGTLLIQCTVSFFLAFLVFITVVP